MSEAGDDAPAVATSLTGRQWALAPVDERLALAIAQRHALPDLLARILAGRGLALDAVGDFLEPSLRTQMPDPDALRDMAAAAERIAAAVMQGESIAIFGDYDVDGATASALLRRQLEALGGTVTVYIPDRMTEGYGPNPDAVARLRAGGASLLITVDCGTTAHAALAAAAEASFDTVVIDHHEAEEALPPALAVVNPNRLDEAGGLGDLAAVGVTFLVAVAINRALRRAGWFDSRPEPDLRGLLDLVALGTVCDVVPLRGLNRTLVAQGLKVMGRRRNPGIAALSDVARLSTRPDAYHLGFMLGPRINAGGRIGDSMLGARLLATDDPEEAGRIAAQLDALNSERRAVEQAVLDDALEQAETQAAAGRRVLLVTGKGWHPGVLGIVAGRLVERHGMPACVAGIADGVAKGSGRSIEGADLGVTVIAARQSGLLSAGGGHPMAAGFTFDADRREAFHAFLEARLAGQGQDPRTRPLRLDVSIGFAGLTVETAEQVARLGPFGMGNREPRFIVRGARLGKVDIVGSAHVRCFLNAEAGSTGKGIKAMAFRAADGLLGQALLRAEGLSLTLAGKLRIDRWQGREAVELHLEDAAMAPVRDEPPA